MQPIRTAVIPIGGLGTRFYPVTKAMPKCLLPVNNRPVIDYIIDNCIAAGLTRLLFVTSAGETQTAHYLREDRNLKRTLAKAGKSRVYREIIEPLHARIEIKIIEQPTGTQRGFPSAIQWAQPDLNSDDQFVVMTGDDFLWRADGGSDLAEMLETVQQHGIFLAFMAKKTKNFDDIKHYTNTATHRGADGLDYLTTATEKPETDIGAGLAYIGRTIFDHSVFEIISRQKPNRRFGETTMADTLNALVAIKPVLAFPMKGRHLDCGTPQKWLATNNFIASLAKSPRATDNS